MRLKSTPEAEDPDDWLWPHHNDQNEWMRYGAGLYLEETRGAIVRRNRGRRSQNGILLDSVTDSQVYDNDFSFLSGWGLALWRSSRNLICRNRFDWCVRGYSHGVYWRGQDSAGILVFEQCCENLFVYNSATHGGDGFFLYAGHETLQETGTGGSNRNLLYRNDFSHAVANGIEATFSGGNRFQENRLEECQHGIWAGYSYETLIVGNEIHRSAGVGIAIEHGHHNQIVGNRFSENPVAIRLWWSPNSQFDEGPYGRHHNTRSEDNLILGNRFLNDRAAVWLRDTHRTQIVRNCWIHCGRHVVQEGDCAGTVLRENLSEAAPGWEPPELEAPVLPELPGEQDPFLPPGAKRGRRYIVIDEWGPVHPDELPD
ncbi:MAG: hypothetical protein KatS3mg115_2349 [Candidatus Poribacteria bacterium]|nr:MAG: hypothetical protein KatS3mg115_2349 [Candidatus Poribacteria bacterium]